VTLALAMVRAAPHHDEPHEDEAKPQVEYRGAQVLRVEAVSEFQKEIIQKMQGEQSKLLFFLIMLFMGYQTLHSLMEPNKSKF